jgi:hypothetical protein
MSKQIANQTALRAARAGSLFADSQFLVEGLRAWLPAQEINQRLQFFLTPAAL